MCGEDGAQDGTKQLEQTALEAKLWGRDMESCFYSREAARVWERPNSCDSISSPVKWDRLVGFAPFATKEPFHHFSPLDSLFRKEKFVSATNSIH